MFSVFAVGFFLFQSFPPKIVLLKPCVMHSVHITHYPSETSEQL